MKPVNAPNMSVTCGAGTEWDPEAVTETLRDVEGANPYAVYVTPGPTLVSFASATPGYAETELFRRAGNSEANASAVFPVIANSASLNVCPRFMSSRIKMVPRIP